MEVYSGRVLKAKGEKTIYRVLNKKNSTKNNHIGLGYHEKQFFFISMPNLILDMRDVNENNTFTTHRYRI